jgi:hypothetical protein
MNRLTKRLLISALVIFYIACGFFREFVFLNINEQSRVTYYRDNDSHVASSMQWLSGLSYETLYYMKWPLTLAFAAWFAFLAASVVKIAFRDKTLVRITWLAYATAFVLGFIFYGIGSLTGHRETTYAIARFLAGLTETPAMLVILLAVFMALRKNRAG